MGKIKKLLFSKLDYEHVSKITKVYKDENRDDLIEKYWDQHPRFRFFKNITSIDSSECRFLDVGSGSGSLFFWKTWQSPIREDIKLYGVDIERGEFADQYEMWKEINIETFPFDVGKNVFDAGLCTHVFEHIHPEKLSKVIKEINKSLKLGAVFYVELPSINSLDYPCRKSWLENDYTVSQQNFYDKPLLSGTAHLKTYTRHELTSIFTKYNFSILESGLIGNKKMATKMMSYGYHNRDNEILNYGLWLAGNWSQYYIIKKTNNCE